MSAMNPGRRALLIAGATAALPSLVQAGTPAEVAAELPGARLQGSGRLRFFGLHVYDARLWVTEGFVAARYAEHPLAIEIEYARTLYGRLIAERSLDEMRRAGALAEEPAQRWLATMRALFPDVSAGDRITGVQRPGEAAHFFHNGGHRGEVRDGEFTRRFFGIWLAPHTSEPALREALIGGAENRR